jgi:uncharacterized protein YbcC (UPF0753/DUF2309 family)
MLSQPIVTKLYRLSYEPWAILQGLREATQARISPAELQALNESSVWQESYELAYREEILQLLNTAPSNRSKAIDEPEAIVAFCIDVRSELVRRHLRAGQRLDDREVSGASH